MESVFFTRDVAELAVKIELPSILEAMREITNRNALHIVVLKPISDILEDISFEDMILYEYSIGNPDSWEYDFKMIARGKAKLTLSAGKPTGTIKAHEYHVGDVRHRGSWGEDNIIVACSGVQGFIDECFSKKIVATIIAICELKKEEFLSSPNPPSFFGETQ